MASTRRAQTNQSAAAGTAFVPVGTPIPEGVKILWQPHPGPQSEALTRTEDEILYGGAKGGGKTACGIAWLIKGNPVYNPDDPIDVSYINHPGYRALVLRKNIIDLADWIDKARRIYEAMGARFLERPLQLFEFPQGSKIILGHLDDKDAYTKYTGQEFQRFLLEEATLVPDIKSYFMVRSCIRSVHRGLHAQTFLTANPGGPGHAWVRDRFVKPKGENGMIIPPMTTIYEKVGRHTRTRVFIPAKLSDNPSLLEDPTYEANLMSLPAAERRAYLDGDWDALSGIYFSEFRPAGPLVGEPPEARHVIMARPLQEWLPRYIGMDWGYAHEGAAYWACNNDDRRLHIYREMIHKDLGAEGWGVEIALASLNDLRGLEDGHMPLFLSFDAWDKRNDVRTVADQIGDGIRKVLGPDAAIVFTSEEVPGDFFERLQTQRKMGISIRKASNQRIAGAQYVRSLLRWWPLTKVERDPFDQELFMRLLRLDRKRATDYRNAYADTKQEVLPGLLIHDCCPRLIQTLQVLVHDEAKPEDVLKQVGDDTYDAFRYLVFGNANAKTREPFRVFAERRVEEITRQRGGQLDMDSLVWVMRKAEADYGQASDLTTDPIYIARQSSRRARFN